MMRVATANCYCCGASFRYFQITKPRRYCSDPCAERRSQRLQNIRRRLKRRWAAQSGTPGQ